MLKNCTSFRIILQYFQRTVKEPSSKTLLRLAELVLTLNCFSFAGNYHKQINGVAMGTKMGPSYANLFVGYVEYQFFNQYDGSKCALQTHRFSQLFVAFIIPPTHVKNSIPYSQQLHLQCCPNCCWGSHHVKSIFSISAQRYFMASDVCAVTL